MHANHIRPIDAIMPFRGRDAGHSTAHRGALLGGLAVAAAALSLCSCVASETPLLAESKPIVGPQVTAQLFRKFIDGKSNEVRTATFRWQDGAYVNMEPNASDVARFVVAPLQADDSIIQSTDAGGKMFRYWIGRKLTDGAYLIEPVDEADVDDAVRTAACAAKQPAGICIVGNDTQLFALARATAARPVKNAEIAVVVDSGLAAAEVPAVR